MTNVISKLLAMSVSGMCNASQSIRCASCHAAPQIHQHQCLGASAARANYKHKNCDSMAESILRATILLSFLQSAGREGREFGAAAGRKKQKTGGLSNKQKQKVKSMPAAARAVQLKRRSGGKQRGKALKKAQRGHTGRSNFGHSTGGRKSR